MQIVKRNGKTEEFNREKIVLAIKKAFLSTKEIPVDTIIEVSNRLASCVCVKTDTTVEDIQNQVENILMANKYYKTAKNYIIYRSKHAETRAIKDRILYMKNYANSTANVADNSNTDANANSSNKNVASLESEVYKSINRQIQRQIIKDQLNKMFPELADQYEIDLNNHIIYTHDEASSPVPKAYCGAYSSYPLLTDGVGTLDGVTPSTPNDCWSFNGQITNAVFALSAQTKGAVALGDYFVSFNHCINQEFGYNWYEHLNDTMKRIILKGMKHFIWGVNQPQGNRGYASPY